MLHSCWLLSVSGAVLPLASFQQPPEVAPSVAPHRSCFTQEAGAQNTSGWLMILQLGSCGPEADRLPGHLLSRVLLPVTKGERQGAGQRRGDKDTEVWAAHSLKTAVRLSRLPTLLACRSPPSPGQLCGDEMPAAHFP